MRDADGRLLLNGGDLSNHQTAFAMSVNVPATRNNASSASMATLIDFEVQQILKQGYEMARTILKEHCDQLTKLADELMEREQLDRKQFENLLQE